MGASTVLSCFLFLVTSVYVGHPSGEVPPDTQNTIYWCADIDCTVPISEGRSILGYHAPSKDHLTFGKNQEVTILSKPLDGLHGHWFGKIRGKVGMIPVNLVKEMKMLSRLEHGYNYSLSDHPLQLKETPTQEATPTNQEKLNEEPNVIIGHDHHKHHHDDEVNLEESELPSFTTVDPVQDGTGQVPPINSDLDTETQKVDLVGHHNHLNPLLHSQSEEHGHEHTQDEQHHEHTHYHQHHEHQVADNQEKLNEQVNEFTEKVEHKLNTGETVKLEESELPSFATVEPVQYPIDIVATERVTPTPTNLDLDTEIPKVDVVASHNHLNPLLHPYSEEHHHEHVHHDHDQQHEPKVADNQEKLDEEVNRLVEHAEHELQYEEQVKLEGSESPSFATVEPVQDPTDATEQVTPTPINPEPDLETEMPKVDLVGDDEPLHPHSEEHHHEHVHHHEEQNPNVADNQKLNEEADVFDKHAEPKLQQGQEVKLEENELPSFVTVDPIQDPIDATKQGTVDPVQGPIDATEQGTVDPVQDPTIDVPERVTVDPIQDPIDATEQVTIDPAPDQIDATEQVSPATPDLDTETQKVDLVGRHAHLNPLLHHHHSEEHEHEHDHVHNHHHHEPKVVDGSSFAIVIQHLSSTLVNFLPEYLQDTILDVNDALVFTGIIALTLISICVPYFFFETFLSVRPLKKKVTELNKNLWKVSTAYENQQEEYDVFKKKALAYDEDKKRIEQLEFELRVIKELESKHKDQIKQQQKELKYGAKVALQVENLVGTTMDERNKAVEERDKLKAVVVSLQASLKETTEELEAAQADAATTQMDLELITHTKENLELKVKAIEGEMLELKQKVLSEVELRRSLQLEKDQIGDAKDLLQEELADLKDILHKYEDTVSDLNQELSLKENELSALKETLGDDSPLIDIAEMTARLQVAESQATSLQSRVESVSLENTSLSRNYEQTKVSLKSLQAEKDQAETRLQVLESYFKEKEEELRTIVEKYAVEKNIRGKDKDELVLMIEEKNDEVKDLSSRLEKLKDEFEQTKLAHRNEIRALEAKSHENWLSLCQSERKAQDIRKESELLRQKLTAVVKGKEAESNDARSSNGDVLSPFMFSQLELEEVPLPIMPDESTLPSYFGLGEDFYGLGGDFEPPAPLDDDEEDADDTLNSRQGREREPQRPPPLGRLSPTFSDNEPDMSPIILPRGGREDYSDGSSSPLHNRSAASRGNWMNGNGTQSTPTRRRGPQQTSSPIQHGLNL